MQFLEIVPIHILECENKTEKESNTHLDPAENGTKAKGCMSAVLLG